ncbi:MAG: A/G-specific adenine glycosylase [Amphiplicatus sp.]
MPARKTLPNPPEKLLSVAPALLAWYGRAARDLPWRVGPAARRKGARPDPYAVWLSEIMLQQTTVATVRPRFEAFLERWPTVEALAAAPVEDVLAEWAGLGYYARARNLHKCARAVALEHGGVFPQTEEGLRALPGIGAYTAAAVAAIAFDAPAVVVDGNVERVVARLFAIGEPLPKARPEIRKAAGSITPRERPGDFAQAMMDLGAAVCTPRAPKCLICPLAGFCAAFKQRAAEAFPVKKAKAEKPTRRGAIFALFNSKGEVLLERREDKGLLGGMLGLPGTAWAEHPGADVFVSAPAQAKWIEAGAIRHTFTHFHLDLDVYFADENRRTECVIGEWLEPEAARLPTVMKKALGRALAARKSG